MCLNKYYEGPVTLYKMDLEKPHCDKTWSKDLWLKANIENITQ